jgi:FHS family L-fucose permease-like MFS transporter
MRFIKPAKLLMFYSLANILLSLVAIFASGMVTVYAVVGICFFMSIMFPTIFSLGIKDLKGDTAFGSSLIIMSIVGGAILTRAFGFISDATNNIQLGYFVPLVCFIVTLFFGWKGYKVINTKI